MEVDAKGMPKCNQNRCQNSSKNNAKIGSEKDHENHQSHQNHVFMNGKIIQINCKKINISEGLAGCVRERKRHQQKHQT